MGWIPLSISVAVAVPLVPAGVRALEAAGLCRPNYLGRRLAFPLGAVVLASALVAIGAGAAFDASDPGRWLAYLIGVALLGLMDDARGRTSPRGLRGHGAALIRAELSTGVIKALGTLGLAAYAASGLDRGGTNYLVDALVLALATHLGNLLDTGPGRVEKTLGLTGLGLCLAYTTVAPVELLAPFIGPVAVGAWFTLRERAMLGDAGASLIGGMIGICLLTTTTPAAAAVALVILIAISLYGEFRSMSSAIGRVPLLERLDSLGRGN